MVSLAPSCQFFRCINNSKSKKPVSAKKAKFCEKSEIFLISLRLLIKNDKSHFWATKKPLLREEVVFKLAFTSKKIRNQDQKARLTTTLVNAFEHE